MFPSQFANVFLTYQTFVTNLHLLRVELRCKLQEKLHRVIIALDVNLSLRDSEPALVPEEKITLFLVMKLNAITWAGSREQHVLFNAGPRYQDMLILEREKNRSTWRKTPEQPPPKHPEKNPEAQERSTKANDL